MAQFYSTPIKLKKHVEIKAKREVTWASFWWTFILFFSFFLFFTRNGNFGVILSKTFMDIHENSRIKRMLNVIE